MNRFIQKTVSVGRLMCNCQILVCPLTHEALLVDPGDEPQKILGEIEKIENELSAKIKVKALFHTHAHFDHINATRAVKEHFQGTPQIFLHKADEQMYLQLKVQAAMFGFQGGDPLPVDQYFEHEQRLRVGSLKFTILHTPGHSPGGVCMRMHEDTAHGISETVFTGDTLFKGSVGRSDLWGGDEDALITSIRERLLVLDGDTIAWPGHGEVTTIGAEARSNPFLS
jgi:glyoxylase-like metal-dependent hydrolase (beta-lactamase superfamily II)